MGRPKKLLVIGGVAAGTKAASKARRVDPEIEISILTDEEYVSYISCGLPYYIGGVVESRDSLFARSPEEFREKHRIEILLGHRAEHLDTRNRYVRAVSSEDGKEKDFHWDKLLVATGAYPVMPEPPGRDMEGIFCLRSITDADKIKSFISRYKPSKACIIGAGYIGCEMAENLRLLGMDVLLLEISPYVMPKLFDPDMSFLIREHIESKGVEILVENFAEEYIGENGRVKGLKTAGTAYDCGMIIVSAGIAPQTEIAENAGIRLGKTGAILVNPFMETSAEDVYSAGDCTETTHLVTAKPVWFPLGSTANKMGRVAGSVIAGAEKKFPGVLGTSIVKIFDIAAGRTGLTEQEAEEEGYASSSVTITTPSISQYYPGGGYTTLKLVSESTTGRLLGAQAVGTGSVDKVIDIAAASLTGRLNLEDITALDLSYAPPYSETLGTIIVAAGVLEKK